MGARMLRVGVAGLGRGRLFVDLFSRTEGCEVVAVCDPVESALEPYGHLATHTDYESFLRERLDVVAVITPGPLHAAQCVGAMVAAAQVLRETPCVYSIAEDYAWMGWAVNLKKKAQEGAFGEIVYAEGDYTHDCRNIMLMGEDGHIPYFERADHPEATKTWRATDLPPLFYVSHTLGPLLPIMDDRAVSATGLSTGCRTAPDLGTTDLEVGLLETEKGAAIRITNGFSVAHPMALHYSIIGTQGSAKMQRISEPRLLWYSEVDHPGALGWQRAPEEWFERPDGEDPLSVMVREFVDSIRYGAPAPIDACRSLDFVLPGVVAHESTMRGGVKLDVPDLRES